MSKGNYNGLIINEETLPVIESIAEGLPGGFFIYHADGDEEFIYVNSQMIKIMGCETEEEFRSLTGNSFRGLVHAEDVDAVEAGIQRWLHCTPDMVDRVKYRVIRADGRVLWIDEKGHFVHTEAYGDIFYVFVIDASDEYNHEMRKRMEWQFRLVDALCHDYLNVYMVNMQEKKAKPIKLDGYVVPGITKQNMLYDYDTLWEKYIKERVHPEDAKMLTEAVKIQNLRKALISKGECVITYRIMVEGNIHYYQVKFTRLNECAEGQDSAIVSFQNMDTVVEKELADVEELRDEKHALEIALEETVRSKLFADRFMNAFDSAYYVDIPRNACIIYRQREYLRERYKGIVSDFFGMTKQYIESEVTEEDRERLAFIADPDRLREWVMVHADGSRNPTVLFSDISMGYSRFVRMYVLSGEDDDHVQIGFTDVDKQIREQKAQEMALEQALATADKANKAKTDFFFNLSHDIRTPMNIIMGYANLLSKYEDDGDRRKDYIKKIQNSSRYLLELINNVLEMAHIESGKLSLNESVWNLMQLGESLENIFSNQLEEKQMHYVCEMDIQNPNVMCDATKVEEIFVNLLSNAVKYTPNGKSVALRMKEFPSSREGYAVFQAIVEDTGIGMSEDFLPHLFENFAREDETEKNKIRGTGLGMPIVKKMVDLLEGSIEVESESGKGTRITVTLPLKIVAKTAGELDPEAMDEDVSAIFEGKRILLAEDNELNAEIAVEILGEMGFEVEHAADGMICVEMLQNAGEGHYDLILMDVQMPGMNGYEAAREIRSLENSRKDIPIIAMTANAFEEDRQNALDAGMNGHVSKPIEVPKLTETLLKILK